MDEPRETAGGPAWHGFVPRPVAAPWLDSATSWIMTGYGALLLLAVPFLVLDYRRTGSTVDTAYARAVAQLSL